jgi:signal transduction histidine kinase
MEEGARTDGVPKPGVLDAELLADFGHQVRNQLNAVVGAAGLLSTGATSSEERELASIVEIGAEQIARLVDDVLDASIIQSGEFELALHPFDVRASVETCIGLVADVAGAKGLDLSFQAAPDVPPVIVGDSRRLEQIVLSLLHGGIERTFRGGVGVELGVEDRGGLVALSFTIRDTGRGIPARILRGGLDGATNPRDHLEPGDRLA